MNTYVYKNHKKGEWIGSEWIAPVVFTCEAEFILAADNAYTSATGDNPIKQTHIGCSWTPKKD